MVIPFTLSEEYILQEKQWHLEDELSRCKSEIKFLQTEKWRVADILVGGYRGSMLKVLLACIHLQNGEMSKTELRKKINASSDILQYSIVSGVANGLLTETREKRKMIVRANIDNPIVKKLMELDKVCEENMGTTITQLNSRIEELNAKLMAYRV